MPEDRHVSGYTDRISARAGESLSVMLSADEPVAAVVRLVRLGVGAGRPESVVDELGTVAVQPQRTVLGSCVVIPGAERTWPAGPFVAASLLMSTRLGSRQTIMSQAVADEGWAVAIEEDGRPSARSWRSGGEGAAVGDEPLVAGAWYLVAGGFEPSGALRVVAAPLVPSASWRVAATPAVRRSEGVAGTETGPPGLFSSPLFLAARGAGDDGWSAGLDGKLETPRLLAGLLDDEILAGLLSGAPLASRVLASFHLGDLGGGPNAVGANPPELVGSCRNSPLRAVTGHNWDASEQDFRCAPDQYRAIHFHSDDLDDSRWRNSLELDLEPGLASGAYAVAVEAGEGRSDRIPFFVRPRRPHAELLFLVPTASYLAYANDHPASDGQMAEAVAGKTPVLYPDDLVMHEHREWGLSCYDAHLDGSGVAFASARRPLMNMRPGHRYHVGPWQLPADLAILAFLADQGIEYDVATDEDLDLDGAGLLAPYRAVLTGTHPEYYSTRMLDGIGSWVEDGGRLVSLGANGFYWRIAYDPERPWVIELRRGQAGSRPSESMPGESHLAFTGELGGLWRHLGRPPQVLTGVGYAGQGFELSGNYRRLADSFDRRAAFIFEGVEGDRFGTSGAIGGGAVGQELDRYDERLGSPADALVLATSEGLGESYLRCVEEVPFNVSGTSALVDDEVRADLVYHVKPGGGAVFATGSIAWAGSLGVDAGVARITTNVLRRFLDPTPLDWS